MRSWHQDLLYYLYGAYLEIRGTIRTLRNVREVIARGYIAKVIARPGGWRDNMGEITDPRSTNG
jgi:hypothetical protein